MSKPDMTSSEQWRDLPKFVGRYQVSNYGRIKSLPNARRHSELIMTPTIHKSGYPMVNLTTAKATGGWKQKSYWLHRLVLETWEGECPPGMEGCHNDGNPLNCRADNLRWDTPKGNAADKLRHGTANIRTQNPNAVLTEDQVTEIKRLLASGVGVMQVSRQFNVSKGAISAIKNGRTWQ